MSVKRAERKLKKNKKKSKTDKKSTEAVNLSEWEHMSKRVVSSSKDHFDDSKSRNWIFKKQQYHVCDDFYFYRKCYYLFSSLTHKNWISRAEIKKMMKKALNEDENFAEKIRKFQKIIKKKKKNKEN